MFDHNRPSTIEFPECSRSPVLAVMRDRPHVSMSLFEWSLGGGSLSKVSTGAGPSVTDSTGAGPAREYDTLAAAVDKRK